jgi:hypothetical protein
MALGVSMWSCCRRVSGGDMDRVCRASSDCGATHPAVWCAFRVHHRRRVAASRASGYLRLAPRDAELLFAWTETGDRARVVTARAEIGRH